MGARDTQVGRNPSATRCAAALPALLVVGTLAACGELTFEDPGVLQLSVASVTPEVAFPGDTLLVVLVARNPSPVDVELAMGGCGSPLGFRVVDSKGQRVGGSGPIICAPVPYRGSRAVIAAGDSLVREDRWAIRDVPYGEYEVMGELGDRTSRAVSFQLSPGVDLHLDVEPSTIRPGEAVEVRVRVSNSRDRPLHVPTFASCLFGVWVFADDDAVALLSECTGAVAQFELGPGEVHVDTLRWSPPTSGAFTVRARLSLAGQPDLEASTRLLVH